MNIFRLLNLVLINFWNLKQFQSLNLLYLFNFNQGYFIWLIFSSIRYYFLDFLLFVLTLYFNLIFPFHVLLFFDYFYLNFSINFFSYLIFFILIYLWLFHSNILWINQLLYLIHVWYCEQMLLFWLDVYYRIIPSGFQLDAYLIMWNPFRIFE